MTAGPGSVDEAARACVDQAARVGIWRVAENEAGRSRVLDPAVLEDVDRGAECLHEGKVTFETKLKSQKAVNLQRDPRITVMVEDGKTYDQLRGVAIEGTAEIVPQEDPRWWAVGVDIWERYQGPYTDEVKPFVEMMMNKRVAVIVTPERVRSWDHRKLGLDPMPLAGTTAEFLSPDGR